jgi:hypothetical protein
MTYISGPLTAAINKLGSKLPCPTGDQGNQGNQGNPNQGNPNQGNPNQGNPNQGNPNQGNPNQGNPNQDTNQSAGYRRTRRLVMKKRKKSLRRGRS